MKIPHSGNIAAKKRKRSSQECMLLSFIWAWLSWLDINIAFRCCRTLRISCSCLVYFRKLHATLGPSTGFV